MPMYDVELIARADVWLKLQVEAESREQAEAFALVRAPTDAQLWQVEPHPIQEVEVTEVTSEEEEADEPVQEG